MPQYPLNLPVGANLGASITTNATTAISTGSATVLAGYSCTNAGSAWTITFYNGNPGSGGVAISPALTVTAGLVELLQLRCPNGLYAVTAGTTAGALQVAYYG